MDLEDMLFFCFFFFPLGGQNIVLGKKKNTHTHIWFLHKYTTMTFVEKNKNQSSVKKEE